MTATTARCCGPTIPKVAPEWARLACCGPSARGIAAWKGKIYIGALDGRLIAVDARTGKQVWSVQTFDRSEAYSITGPPRVFDGIVVIGNGGADYGVRGFVTAYDAATGKKRWRFYTVPGNPADGPDGEASDDVMPMATKTWNGEWWKYGGGGTVWDSFVYDPELRLVYLGTGNGGPHVQHFRSPAGGDNLFLCSIVAVNVETGKYVWHYQMVPDEQWDFTCTQPIVLADLNIDGQHAQGADAGAQERLLLRARSRDRQGDFGEELCAQPLGIGHRPGHGATERVPGILSHRDAQAHDANTVGGAHLAPHVIQPATPAWSICLRRSSGW